MNRNKNTFSGFEDPLAYAISLSEHISGKRHTADKQRLGQYFTPTRLAEFTAGSEKDFLNTLSGTVRILDPGTGTGILSCALIQKLAEIKSISNIELTCYEIDNETADGARQSFDYLDKWLRDKGLSFSFSLYLADFISEHSGLINSFPDPFPPSSDNYDIIISNPPFFKISSGHPYIASAGFNFRYHLNIYHLFLFISANLLKNSGRMLFIIPSAFFAGGYFAELRKIILKLVSVEKVLFFRPAEEIFEPDSMLADTAVVSFSFCKSGASAKKIGVTAFKSYPAAVGFEYSYNYDPLINRLPFFTGPEEMELFNKVNGWPSTVLKAGYRVNAGHLLYTEALSSFPSVKKSGAAKILYLFLSKILDHKNIVKEKHIYSSDQMFYSGELPGFVQPPGNLVLIRRYNSAGAVPVQSSPFFIDNYVAEYMAVDKRLLFLTRSGCDMTPAETAGLSLILNSRLLREYIWITYGKINLTIQEFLELPLPSEDVILRAGKLYLSSFFNRSADN